MSYNITVTMDQLIVTDATESTPLVTIRKPTSGGSGVTVDTALSTSSYNAIANAPVATAINSVNASLTDVEDDVTALQNAVTALGNAYPTVVSLASAMTDTSAIYLYAGSENGYVNGDWYYYDTDTSTWVDGGTYGTGKLSTSAKNLLIYILRRAMYTEDVDPYITALNTALDESSTPAVTYSITYTLSHITSDVNTATITEGSMFTCTLTADEDYIIDTVTVTMGGTDVTSTVYNNGTIIIGSVSGNVVITATSAVAPATADYDLGDPLTMGDSTDSRVNDTTNNRIYTGVTVDNFESWTIFLEFTSLANGTYHAISSNGNLHVPGYWAPNWQVAWQGRVFTIANDNNAGGKHMKVAVTHEANATTVNVQGTKTGSLTYSSPSTTTNGQMYINVGTADIGTLHQFKIYKQVLSADEITAWLEAE